MSEELTTEERKKAINLQDLVYVRKYIDDNHYDKAETELAIDAKINIAKEEIGSDIDAAIEASNKSYTKEEADELFLKQKDAASLATKAERILDKNSGAYKEVAIMTPEEYASSGISSDTIYFVKET